MSEFLAMGGYASYVWSAYAVFFMLLFGDAVMPLLRYRQTLRDLRGRQQREARRNKS